MLAPSPSDDASARELVAELYGELKRLAAARLGELPPGQTLQPTALVHEAYLRLERHGDSRWENRRHFFGAAARAMHDILVEQARRKGRIKHGGGLVRRHLAPDDEGGDGLDELPIAEPSGDMDGLRDALERLRDADPGKHELVMLSHFAGLPHAEIAELLGKSLRTVEREWAFCRAWLRDAMKRA